MHRILKHKKLKVLSSCLLIVFVCWVSDEAIAQNQPYEDSEVLRVEELLGTDRSKATSEAKRLKESLNKRFAQKKDSLKQSRELVKEWKKEVQDSEQRARKNRGLAEKSLKWSTDASLPPEVRKKNARKAELWKKEAQEDDKRADDYRKKVENMRREMKSRLDDATLLSEFIARTDDVINTGAPNITGTPPPDNTKIPALELKLAPEDIESDEIDIWDEERKEQAPEAGSIEGLIQDPDSWNDSHAPYTTNEVVKAPDVGMGEVPDSERPAQNTDEAKASIEDITGEWSDGEHTWYIRGGKENGGIITIARQRGGKKGDEAVFSNARFAGGKIRASRTYDDVRDMKASLPSQIKAKLVGDPRAIERLELKLVTNKKSRARELRGLEWGLMVTYSPDDYSISKIHSPFSKPLTLTAKDKSKKYRVGKITVDNMPLYLRLDEWKRQLEKLRIELEREEKKIPQQAAEFEKADKQLRDLRREKKALEKKKKVASQEIQKLFMPPSVDSYARLGYERVRWEIDVLLLKKEAVGLSGQEASDLAGYRRELAHYAKKIAQARPAPYQSVSAYDARVAELNTAIRQIHGRLSELPLLISTEESKRYKASLGSKISVEQIDVLEKSIKLINSKLPPIKQMRKTIDVLGGLISEIDITDSENKDVFYAVLEIVSYKEKLEMFDFLIEKIKARLDEAKRVMSKARSNFVIESGRASELSEIVTDTIMNSARKQQVLEVGSITFDVIKDFIQGGPILAISGAVYKLAIQTPVLNLGGGKGLSVRKSLKLADEGEIEKIVLAQMRQTMGKVYDANASLPWKEKAYQRGEKVALSKLTKDKVKNVALRNGAGRWAQELALKSQVKSFDEFVEKRMEDAWIERRVLKARTKRIVTMTKDLEGLKKPNPALVRELRKHLSRENIKRGIKKFNWKKSIQKHLSKDSIKKTIKDIDWKKAGFSVARTGGDFVTGYIKDMSISAIETSIVSSEKNAWYDYFVQDLIARGTLGARKISQKNYWSIRDEYNAFVEARKVFIDSVDPESNYKITTDKPFKSDSALIVKLYAFKGEGTSVFTLPAEKASVMLGGVVGKPNAKSYSLRAEKIKAENNARLPLTLKLK